MQNIDASPNRRAICAGASAFLATAAVLPPVAPPSRIAPKLSKMIDDCRLAAARSYACEEEHEARRGDWDDACAVLPTAGVAAGFNKEIARCVAAADLAAARSALNEQQKALDRHEDAKRQLANRHNLDESRRRANEATGAHCDLMDAISEFPARTIADLEAKFSFLRESDWLHNNYIVLALLKDVQRLSASQSRSGMGE